MNICMYIYVCMYIYLFIHDNTHNDNTTQNIGKPFINDRQMMKKWGNKL